MNTRSIKNAWRSKRHCAKQTHELAQQERVPQSRWVSAPQNVVKRISCSSRNCNHNCYHAVYKSDYSNTRYTSDYRTSSPYNRHPYNNNRQNSLHNYSNNHKNSYSRYYCCTKNKTYSHHIPKHSSYQHSLLERWSIV